MAEMHDPPRLQYPGWVPVSGLPNSRSYVLILIPLLLVAGLHFTGFFVLGDTPAGTTFSDAVTILANLLGIAGTGVAFLRSRERARTFWFLFCCALSLQFVGNAGWAYNHFFQISVADNSLFPSLFYRLPAAPLAIALFLSEDRQNLRLASFLDHCMVVGLVGLATYQVQMAELGAHDPKIWQLIGVETLVNGVLTTVAAIRFMLATPGNLKSVFGRQTSYLSVFLAVSFITSLVDSYLPRISSIVDLMWIVPYLTAAALAVTWQPARPMEQSAKPVISRRTSLLCFNLTLAFMVLGSASLGFRLINSTRVIGVVAVGFVLCAFAIRSALMQDTQERLLEALRESEGQLQRQALYDELTGLPNRRLFGERLAHVLAIAEREKYLVALLYVDLDGFKPVNDLLGHGIGDMLLNQVAQRMLIRSRRSDTLARMGGDEFIWLVAYLPNRDEAAQLAESMLKSLREPFEIQGNSIQITASIGIALYPESTKDAAELIQWADAAMYGVKREGGNGVAYFVPEMTASQAHD